jgi:hypothetical protein
MVPLSELTHKHLTRLFPAESQSEAATLLEQGCDDSLLPFGTHATPQSLERIRLAALKVSQGDLADLHRAVELAKIDWRDLLVAAEFAEDVRAHLKWQHEEVDR